MSNRDQNNYIFLNRHGRWPGFESKGLQLDDEGTLRLLSVPLFSGSLPEKVRAAATPDGPAGLAIDRLGAVYFSDPVANKISRIDNCDGSAKPIPCIGGAGSRPCQFLSPRGLLVPNGGNALFVADSGNHRIQVFDLSTFQLIEIWGQENAAGDPKPGSKPGEFDNPWTLASDHGGNIYVVDRGNQRVQKFNAIGDVDSGFWQKLNVYVKDPLDIAVCKHRGSDSIFVLDNAGPRQTIFVFHADGSPVLDTDGNAASIVDPELHHGMGMAASADYLYVGDNDPDHRHIRAYHIAHDYEFSGNAIGYDAPVAALLLDAKGGLLVHPGDDAQPVRLSSNSGSTAQAVLWNTVPVEVADRKVPWHRLQALIQPLAENAHLDLFTYVTSNDDRRPNKDRPEIYPDSSNPFSDKRWNPRSFSADADLTDVYIGGKEAKYLWIGVLFVSNGTAASPALSQLRVEFDHPIYDQYLPAIFRDRKDCDEFLPRLLSLFESFNAEVESEINLVPALFDPNAAPSRFLPWLAGILGFELDENWSEEKQRELTSGIFRLSRWHGTRASLRQSLRLFAGVDAVIEEPILNAGWWALPSTGESCCDECTAHASAGAGPQDAGNSILGWTTMLAPAQPQGAVVGTSCDLDQSHLITDDDFGAPLFTDVAYQFSVGVYRGQVMCADALARVQSVIENQKPAHTTYRLCVIEPRFRVGFQSRVGVDTVVAGTPRSLSLGSGQGLGTETVLAGEGVSQLGKETRLGMTAPLS